MINIIGISFHRKSRTRILTLSLLLVSILIVSYVAFTPTTMNSSAAPTPTSSTMPQLSKISQKLLDQIITTEGNEPIKVLIETYTKEYETVATQIVNLGGKVTHTFRYVNGLAAEITASKIIKLATNPNIKKIYLDELRYPAILNSEQTTLGGSEIQITNEDIDLKLRSEETFKIKYEDEITVTLNQDQIETLTAMLIEEPNTYWNPVAMGAINIWALGDYGQGSLAVIIDTGIYADHFMLSGSVIGGVDLSPDVGTEYEGWNRPDNHWHGTHVAGILAGHGAVLVHSSDPLYQAIARYASPPPEASSLGYPGYHIIPLFGMAPMAQLYAIKVFPHTGAGVSESIIIQGIEYAISLKLEQGYDVDIISMSLGGPTLFDGRDLEDQVVDFATSVGITVVAAAGNEGPAAMTIGSPGTAETAITVAAAAHPVNTRVFWDINYGKPGIGYQLFTSDIPQIYAFSSRGPTSDGRDKPDIAATGMFVLSAYNEPEEPQSIAFASGTSMATPAVSGAVALLNTYAEACNLGATPLDYKQALKNGAIWLEGYDKYDQGAGYLNAYNALKELIRDPSIGDVYPPLPEKFELADITNIPIEEAGTYEDSIKDLQPGHKVEYIFKVTYLTSKITLEITNTQLNRRNPYKINSFEVYIQSAKRSTYAYWIETANVWGNAKFEITDYGTTWYGAVTGVYNDTSTLHTAIEPGYVKIVIENDWTSSGPISCDIKITVEATPPQPDEVYSGTVVQDEWILLPVTPPEGTKRVVMELCWQNDWSKYPTSDLDLYVQWFNGTDWVFEPLVEGATLNSPERVIIESEYIGVIYIYINGYWVFNGPELWYLAIYYFADSNNYVTL